MGAHLIRRLSVGDPHAMAIITINFYRADRAPGGVSVDRGRLPRLNSVRARCPRQRRSVRCAAQTGVGNISDSHTAAGDSIRGASREITIATASTNRCMLLVSRCYGTIFGISATVRFAAHPYWLTLIKIAFPSHITPGIMGVNADYLFGVGPARSAKPSITAVAFDVWSSAFIIIASAIPAFLFTYFINRLLPAAATTIFFRLRGPGFRQSF